MIEWFVAKYMSDLRRREPRNVGVILSVDGQLVMRFLGERNGEMDARKARLVASSTNYKDWVHFWRSLRHAQDLPLIRGATDNYYIERGGHRLVGAEEDPQALLDTLYAQIVAPSEHGERDMDPVAELFASLDEGDVVDPIVEREPVIETDRDAFPFDYGVRTSTQRLLFRKVAFNGSPRKTWDSLHAAAEAVGQVAAQFGGQYAPYVIGYEKDPGEGLEKQIQAMERRVTPQRFRLSAGLTSDRAWLHSLGAPILVGSA